MNKFKRVIVVFLVICSIMIFSGCYKKMAKRILSLNVEGKTEYVLNEEMDKKNYTFTVVNDRNEEEEIDASLVSVKAFDTSAIGQKTIMFSYQQRVKLFNIYVYEKCCTVSFVDEEGNELLPNQNVYYGKTLSRPQDPTKEPDGDINYTFAGWFINDISYDFSEVVNDDLVLVGSFESDEKAYKCSFVNYDGTEFASFEQEYGSTIVLPKGNPKRDNEGTTKYEFAGWEGFTEGMTITGNIVFKALYTEILAEHEYIFYSDDEVSIIASGKLAHGDEIPVPTATKESTDMYTYTFISWDIEVPSEITSDIIFVAKFEQEFRNYTYSFMNGEVEVSSGILSYGSDIPAPTSEPVKEETAQFTYEFNNWDKEVGKLYTDMVFNAVFTSVTRKYTYAFYNEGILVGTQNEADYGSLITLPNEPSKPSTEQFEYEFAGWEGYTSGMTLTDDIGFIATYTASTRSYDVNFLDYLGNEILDLKQSIEYGSKAEVKECPEREATATQVYEVLGWYLNGSLYDFNTPINGEINLTATYNQSTRYYDVKFVGHNDSELGVSKVAYEGQATAPTNVPSYQTEDKIYTFSGWDKGFSSVTTDMVVNATYTSSTRYYTVVFKNYDGTVLKTDNGVTYNGTTTAPTNPTKPMSNTEVYTFNGWDKGFSNVTADMVVNATYTPSTRYYTVVFKNYDDTVLKTDDKVNYNGTTTAPTNPTKPMSNTEIYTFNGWDKDFDEVTTDMVVKATYTPSTRYYTVVFKNYDNEVLKTDDKVTYNGTASAPANNPTREDGIGENDVIIKYTFSGWDKAFTNVTENIIVTAKYSETEMNIIQFVDIDNSPLANTQYILAGNTIVRPSDPVKEESNTATFEFDNWYYNDVVFNFETPVTSNMILVGKFNASIKYYTVVFKNYDGTVLKTDNEVTYNGTTTAPTDPTKPMSNTEVYTFSGWDKGFSSVTTDMEVNATYTTSTRYYTVVFKNYDDTVLKTDDKVTYNGTTTAPTNPTKPMSNTEIYTFSGWDKDFDEVTTDMVVKATYTTSTRYYTVVFKNYDGTVLKTDNEVTYNGTTTAPTDPTKPMSNTEIYTFSGWDKGFSSVTTDMEVNATYTTSIRTYKVIFQNDDNTEFASCYVEYGNNATLPATNPTSTFGKQFTGWSSNYTNITVDDTIVTAIFSYVNFTINYVKNDDSSNYKVQNINNPTSIDVRNVPLTLNAPSRYGAGVFAGWCSDSALTTVKSTITLEDLQALSGTNITVYAKWENVAKNESGTLYQTIDDAIEKNSSEKITVLKSSSFADTGVNRTSTLSATLFLPHTENVTDLYTKGEPGNSIGTYAFANPTTYRYLLLTIPETLTINLTGTIQIASVIGYQSQLLQGHTSGKYSELCVNGILNVTGTLNTYGLITGSGEINALSGSKIYSPFVVLDFEGGTITAGRYNGNVSPFNRYEMPNIQTQITINYGSTYYGYCSLWADDKYNETVTNIIGNEESLINLSNGARAIKTFDTSKKTPAGTNILASAGHTTIRIIGGATVGSMTLNAAGTSVTTSDVLFPICCEYSIILEGGTYTMGYKYKLLPGASLEVASDATLNLNSQFIVYSVTTEWKVAAGDIYPKDLPAANFVINGVFNINSNASFGGLITTTQSGGTIVINSSATMSVSSKEGSGERKYYILYNFIEHFTKTCTAQAYIGNTITNLTKGKTYTSNGSNWVMN